jgi:hypothetical protein
MGGQVAGLSFGSAAGDFLRLLLVVAVVYAAVVRLISC